MHIEVWQSSKTKNVDDKNIGAWYWHKVASNGKIVTDAEPFPTMTHAIRAAHAEIVGTIKPYRVTWGAGPVEFLERKWNAKKQCWVIRWS